LLKDIKIALVEDRPEDAWFDLSLRQLRVGEVRFYRVDDLFTGKWLFKVCFDRENSKTMVKAVKCPAGILYSQLEGNTMLFQKSIINDDLFYDVISLSHVDGEGKVRREIAKSIDDVPSVIRENFDVKPYEEATGKKLPTSYLVTLSKRDNEKGMVTLFLLQRAWALPQEEKQKTLNLLALIKKLEKTSIAEISGVASEEFGIEKDALDRLLADLEAKGKIKRLDEGHVKAA
jgi:hypothetical protein